MTDPELKQWSNFRAPDGGVLRQYNKKRGRFRASRVTYDTNGQKLGVVLVRLKKLQIRHLHVTDGQKSREPTANGRQVAGASAPREVRVD